MVNQNQAHLQMQNIRGSPAETLKPGGVEAKTDVGRTGIAVLSSRRKRGKTLMFLSTRQQVLRVILRYGLRKQFSAEM